MAGEAKAVGMQFTEAVDFFRQKVNMPTTHWTAVMDEAHARSFAIAGATNEAMLEDFRKALDGAIADGTGFNKFRGEFFDIVKKYGWKHTGRPGWRAKVIYDMNLRTAFAAGRYAQMTRPAVLEAFPFWQYHHINCPNPRLQHVAWDGKIWRWDDPVWNYIYPPNGFGCHCQVTSCGMRDLARMGKDGPDESPNLQWRDYVNRTTGVVVKVPAGVDPGFAYNPGKAWLEGRKQIVKSPDLKAEGPAPPVLAAPRATSVAPAVVRKFLEMPAAADGIQIAEVTAPESGKAAPAVLGGDVARAAAKAGIALDEALVRAIAAELPRATGARDQPKTRAVIVKGLVVALKWDADLAVWMISGIRKDTQ